MKTIDLFTKTTHDTRAGLIRKFANLPLENQVQIMKSSIDYQYKNKDNLSNFSNPEARYISIIESIDEFTKKRKFDRMNIENEAKRLRKEEIIKVQRIKQKYKKGSKIKEKLLSKKYWLLVEKLKIVDKLSYAAIAEYLLRYHKFKIHGSYIAKCWKEVKCSTLSYQ